MGEFADEAEAHFDNPAPMFPPMTPEHSTEELRALAAHGGRAPDERNAALAWAADRIENLEAENAEANNYVNHWATETTKARAENARLTAEVGLLEQKVEDRD